MIDGGENPRAVTQRGMRRFVVNRETAAKLAAGALVAIALVVSLPALMKSEQPAPLPADVGLPQAPAPVPAPPLGPDPAAARQAAKPAAAQRRAARRKAERRRKRESRRRERKKRDDRAPETGAPVASTGYAAPSGTYEDFGFEQPRP
jgi:hypothetical protein